MEEKNINSVNQAINESISIADSLDITLDGLDFNDMNMSSANTYSISDSTIGTITIGGGGGGGTFYGTGPNTQIYTTTVNSTTFGSDLWGGLTADNITSRTGKTIGIDDLIDTIDTIKRRLLILTPNFELHEKYPMLKEMYDEYKAMERLLSGPDSGLDDQAK